MGPLFLATALAFLSARAGAATTRGFDLTHARLAGVLSATVTNGLVDYAHIKAQPAELDAYLADVAAIPAEDFARWNREDRLALLLNLYNAQTLRLIADHYPVSSVRSIGVLPGAVWRKLVVRFSGQVISLDHLEHRITRAEYHEPRLHFALVCAALGCPPLREEPYVGARLGRQLDDQGRRFLAQTDKNRFEPATGTLWLSPIFKWFKEDFLSDGGTLENYVQPFLPDHAGRELSAAQRVRIRFTDYDWTLNAHRP